MRLQLHFSEPMQISSSGMDTIQLSFLAPEIFMLGDKSAYLFDEANQEVVYYKIPP